MTDVLPKYLYRYRKLGSSFAKVVCELYGELWCSYSDYLNDPFDGLNDIKSSKHLLPKSSPKSGVQEKNKLIEVNKIWAVACFSETHKNPTMWAHYADNYSGVCIEYDTELLLQSSKTKDIEFGEQEPALGLESRLVKVNYYDEKFPELDSPFDLASAKTIEWSYEKEWRLITQGYHKEQLYNTESGTIINTNNAISRVLYGPNQNRSKVKILGEILELKNIKPSTIRIRNGEIF